MSLPNNCVRRAQSARDPALLLYAHFALGDTSFWMGEFLTAREHLEMAISIYEPERHRPLTFHYGGVDAGVFSMSYAAWTLWYLGYPDQALKRGNEALELAQTLSHAFSRAFAGFFSGFSVNIGAKHAQLKRLRRVRLHSAASTG
jgi:tetratricopeptide (TPR) repeat protein